MKIFTPKRILVFVGVAAVLFITIVLVGGIKPDADNNSVKVVRAVDGDTVELENREMVRYIGIDTPETVDPSQPVECFGVEASLKNKELVEGKMARIERDISDRDKYSRLLRYIWIEDTLINLELVKQGFAYASSYPPDVKYQSQLAQAQEEARGANRGLWSACPAGPEEPAAGARP